MKSYSLIVFTVIALYLLSACNSTQKERSKEQGERWSIEKANTWYSEHPWLVGCNFIPSTAINQLEMWQTETFDPATIDCELGWAEDIGMNCVRVYLHHLAWEIDKEGFKIRIDKYLEIANSHRIKTILIFFDDCWNATYQVGKQPEPIAGKHNSGWVRDPGDLLYQDSTLISTLEEYVKDVVITFKDDERIIIWDLYNEPGNNYGDESLPLLEKVFEWSRQINPSQPLTSGVNNITYKGITNYQVMNSDIITYHNYKNPENHQHAIDTLRKYNRPLICTEYMARINNSLFQNTLPILKKENIGAINWGLVAGKTNTIYPWGKPIPGGAEPELWFCDIFRLNGQPYKQEEVDLIKKLIGQN